MKETNEAKGIKVIDEFLAQWKIKAMEYYKRLREENKKERKKNYKITEENLKAVTDVWGDKRYSDEKVAKF